MKKISFCACLLHITLELNTIVTCERKEIIVIMIDYYIGKESFILDCTLFIFICLQLLPSDYEAISSMLTFEHLNLICQSPSIPIPPTHHQRYVKRMYKTQHKHSESFNGWLSAIRASNNKKKYIESTWHSVFCFKPSIHLWL